MANSSRSRTIAIPASATIALDLRGLELPFGYVVRPGASTTIVRTASCASRPGNKFANPAVGNDVDSAQIFFEDYGVSFMRLSNGATEGFLDIYCVDPDRLPIHYSTDTLTSIAQDPLALDAGAEHNIAINDLFTYSNPGGAVDATVASSDETKATVSFDHENGAVTITAVAAGTSNITVNGRTPANVTASATVAVTVS